MDRTTLNTACKFRSEFHHISVPRRILGDWIFRHCNLVVKQNKLEMWSAFGKWIVALNLVLCTKAEHKHQFEFQSFHSLPSANIMRYFPNLIVRRGGAKRQWKIERNRLFCVFAHLQLHQFDSSMHKFAYLDIFHRPRPLHCACTRLLTPLAELPPYCRLTSGYCSDSSH